MTKSVTNENFNQINILELWEKAAVNLRRPITNREIEALSGVSPVTVAAMRRGKRCQAEKLAKVASALYQVSGLPQDELVIIAWIGGVSDAIPNNT